MSQFTELYPVIEDGFKRPLVPHEPAKQSLKQWSMFVLRDKGFKVVYAQNADFAIERGAEKLYFKVVNKVANINQELDENFSWIIWDNSTQNISIVLAKK
jgi:cobyrinic acid a,c-diamide synthase